jgi:hypothetical protein
MMKRPSSIALVLLCAVLALGLPACGGSKKNPFGKKTTQRDDISEVGAVEGPVQERKFAEPTASQTLYLLYLRDKENRPVAGASAMVLVQPPEGLNINQPRRKTVVAEMPSGPDGISPIMSVADGKPKWAWVGGKSVWPPAVYELQPAVGGNTVKMTLQVPIQPIAKIVITGPDGLRVPDAIVTFKPIANSPGEVVESGRPNQSDNYGNTKRTNGMGEIDYPRPAGRYGLIATDDQGRNRLYAEVNWTGDASKPLNFTLPAQSMTEKPWWY